MLRRDDAVQTNPACNIRLRGRSEDFVLFPPREDHRNESYNDMARMSDQCMTRNSALEGARTRGPKLHGSRSDLLASQQNTDYFSSLSTKGFCIVDVIFDEDDVALEYRFPELKPVFVQQTALNDAMCKRIRQLVSGATADKCLQPARIRLMWCPGARHRSSARVDLCKKIR